MCLEFFVGKQAPAAILKPPHLPYLSSWSILQA
jgi:hypothetical protein